MSLVWVLAIASVTVLSGCSPREQQEVPLSSGAGETSPTDVAAVAAAPSAADPTPAATANEPMGDTAEPTENGVQVVTAADIATLRNKAGDKPLVVNLWATWCIPCREEMPAFAQYYETYGDDEVIFLSLASDEPDAAASFKKEEALPFPVYVIGADVELEDVSKALGIEIDGVLPTTVFFNFGERAEVHEGKLTFEQLEAKTKASAAA
jgi:thiol-disulfide isomerase/thioredoxin